MDLVGKFPVLEEKIEKWAEEEKRAARIYESKRIDMIKKEIESKGLVYNGQAEIFYRDQNSILFKDNVELNLQPQQDLFIFDSDAYKNRQNREDFRLSNCQRIEYEITGDLIELLDRDFFNFRHEEIKQLFRQPGKNYQLLPFVKESSAKIYLVRPSNSAAHLKSLGTSRNQRFEFIDQNEDQVILLDKRNENSIGMKLGVESHYLAIDKRMKYGKDLRIAKNNY